MKQTKLMSMLESVLSTAIGFGVALATQILVFPLFGFDPSLTVNLAITVIFTFVSIVRQFCVRRLFEALHIRRPLSPFMQAVVAERYRQIEDEGRSHQYDDGHRQGDLARAGAAYVLPETVGHVGDLRIDRRWHVWPWRDEDFKPDGFRRDLVKGCALIIAEGERHDRNRRPDRSVTLVKALSPDSNKSRHTTSAS